MTKPAAKLARARQRLAAGDVDGARREGEALLGADASDAERADSHLLLAACAQHAKDPVLGLRHARMSIALRPEDPVAHYLNAELAEAAGDKPGAIASLDRAVALKPAFVQAWFYRGILRGEGGDALAAIDSFRETVRLDPAHARGWNNLGNALRRLARLRDAESAFETAVALKPDYWLAVANLAKSLRDTGEVERAESLLRDALARSPSNAPYRPLLVLLAGLLRERGFLDEAAQLYGRAIQAAPEESAQEWFHLGLVLGERGEAERAREAYRRSYALDRRELRALFGAHLALPMIYADALELDAARERFGQGLVELETALPKALEGLSSNQVIDGLRWTNFFLAYQGRDDLALQVRYSRIVHQAVAAGAPEWHAAITRSPGSRRRVRIGFASAFLHVGTVGRYFRSWITELPRDRFEVFIYHLWPGMDEVASEIHARADTFRSFGGSDARPSIIAPAIRADDLDVLVYPELGMDVTSFALAALRLAPRQLCAWGHPITTAHPTIDAFISCAAMEPADAPAQYAEQLVLLPGIGTSYRRPDVPEDATRSALGLPDDQPVLLCPQSLFKIHPDNDELLLDIVIANPRALLVLFSGRHPAVTDQFMRRLERAFARRGVAVRERVRVLPQLPHADYMRVNLVADAMVDTLHWSGGNTSLDALACGLPVVTLPGAYMRGRQSAAMLRLLGVDELIARDRADYLAITSRLVEDGQWRGDMRMRIRAAQPRLFERNDALARLVELFGDEATSMQ